MANLYDFMFRPLECDDTVSVSKPDFQKYNYASSNLHIDIDIPTKHNLLLQGAVEQLATSSSLDSPEGGFDALAQVISCQV